MLNGRAPFRVGGVTALFLAVGALLLRADSPPPAPPGYHLVQLSGGDKPSYIQVKNDANPYAGVSSSSSSDKYRPDEMSFSTQSSLANKTFSSGPASAYKKNDAAEQRTFVTKSYLGDNQTASESSTSDATTKTPGATAFAYGKNAAGFDKSFSSSSFDAGPDKAAALASTTSTYQGREASLNSEKPEVFADSSLATKQYLGPGAQHVPDGITVKENIVLTRMSGVPNRPLTIDEVRDLINHDVTPDTTAKPAPETKPLNDPAYKPPSRPAPSEEDDKNDPVPPPGMMAAPQQQPPENSEPLPH